MKKHRLIIAGIIIVIASLAPAHAEESVADTELGLSKTSVFETPSPEPFNYMGDMPFGNPLGPRAFPGAPPQIPHNIEPMIPVTAKTNFCLGCHDNPEKMDKKPLGEPTPMPSSHYTDLRNAPDKVTKKVIGARYVCTQCHVPQADVKALVNSTFK